MAMQIGELAPAMELPQVFTHEQFGEIRTILEGDEIIFVAADACRALDIANVGNVMARLDADEKGIRTVDTLGGPQKMSVVTEAGLYRLIFMSRKPNAKEFQRWICHEVIPAIRKHGAYMTPATIEQILEDPDLLIRLATELKAERQKVREQAEVIAEQQEQIAALEPKANYCDAALNSDETLTVRQIAQNYGMNPIQFNKLLAKLGVQFKQGGVWYLYEKYNALGWAVTETFCFTRSNGTNGSNTRTVWTQKGKQGLYELLKENGYEPTAK